MALQIPERPSAIVPLQIGFSYYDERKERCFVTFTVYRRTNLQISPRKRVEIRNHDRLGDLQLSAQEESMVTGIRHAQVSGQVPNMYIRLGHGYAMVGPYPLDGIAEQVAAILAAIHEAYVPSDRIRPTLMSNWPIAKLHKVVARLSQPDCRSFITGIRAQKTLQ